MVFCGFSIVLVDFVLLLFGFVVCGLVVWSFLLFGFTWLFCVRLLRLLGVVLVCLRIWVLHGFYNTENVVFLMFWVFVLFALFARWVWFDFGVCLGVFLVIWFFFWVWLFPL